jgi:ribosomal protein L11 methyltransferase
MTQTWKIAVTASAISSSTYEAALEPFSIALSIYEADTDLPKTRGLPEPANWAGDLWLAEACIVEAIAVSAPNRIAIEQAVAIAAASLDEHPPEVTITEVPDIDWQAEVLANLQPIEVGRFRVRGRHIKSPARPGIIDLEIEAGAAFGSGEHETTRACLEALTAALKRQHPRRVLDLGCGTGVLGLAAAKAVKPKLLMTDIDGRAVEVARLAAEINHVRAKVRRANGWQNAEIMAQKPYDLVLANILARPLRAMAGNLARALKPGGRAILSGFLYWQESFVMAPHRAHGLKLERRTRRGDWLALTLRRGR